MVKNPPANEGDSSWIPESGRSPGVRNGYPWQFSLSGESHGQESLTGYSPWGCQGSNTTERPSFHT